MGLHAMSIYPGDLNTCTINCVFVITPTYNHEYSEVKTLPIQQEERKGENNNRSDSKRVVLRNTTPPHSFHCVFRKTIVDSTM